MIEARRLRRPRRARNRVLAAAAFVVAFAVGLALGEALNDNPSAGETQTRVRTLKPLQIPPAAHTTVTVTITGP